MSAINKHPVVTSYNSVEDLLTLKDWFYNFDEATDNRSRGIERVKALASRGRLPHAIEATSLLTSVALSDPTTASATTNDTVSVQSDSNILQLSYSMALVRFVNGLLDPFQQSNFALPLHQLARTLKLPSLFVELRHMGTHEQLPNLETLRLASNKALNWLFDNYWLTIGEKEGEDDNADESNDVENTNEDTYDINKSTAHNLIDESKLSEKDKQYVADEYKKLKVTIDGIVNEVKAYKKIRKLDLDKEYKFGNSTDLGKKYWKAIKNLQELTEKPGYKLFIVQSLMYKNLLIYNIDKLKEKEKKQTKLNPLLIKLYKPLLDELGIPLKFSLLFSIFYTLNHNEGDDPEVDLDTLVNYRIGFTIHDDAEIIQLLGWARYLMEDLLSYDQKFSIKMMSGDFITNRITFVEMLIKDIPAVVNSRRSELLDYLAVLYKKNNFQNKEVEAQLTDAIENMKKALIKKNFAPPPSIDSLLADSKPEESENLKRDSGVASIEEEDVKAKKPKSDSSQSEHFVFEEVKDWEPTAFGNSV